MLMVWGTLEEAPFRLAPAEVEEAPDKVVAAAARLGISPLQQPVCKPVQEAICHYAERADEGARRRRRESCPFSGLTPCPQACTRCRATGPAPSRCGKPLRRGPCAG